MRGYLGKSTRTNGMMLSKCIPLGSIGTRSGIWGKRIKCKLHALQI